MHSNERADREVRQAYGLPLSAAYRHLIGPAPHLLPSDRAGARAYLERIQLAVDTGGWTRSEWMRLRRLKAKWTARAAGGDARFDEAGNRQGGLTEVETANVKHGKAMERMRRILDRGRRGGD
jgi:hypothetical protein